MVSSVRLQRNIAFLAFALFAIKLVAWWWTKSVSVFTDAMESTVNVATGLIGWYSVWLSSKPRDKNHPYGHGKAEYISSAIEGTLIIIAGLVIIYEAVVHFSHPVVIQKLDWGLALLAFTAILNYAAGSYAIKRGISARSIALQAGGKHLKTDTYSTLGIILGLLILKFTGWQWLDSTIAIGFAIVILLTGYKVMRKSLAGIMDEADMKLLDELIAYLQANRKPEWTDLHNLRTIQYGSILHLDGHLTLPWYLNVKEAHQQIDELDLLIRKKFGDAIELFVHVDGCEPFSCKICTLAACPKRQHPLEKIIVWDADNVLQNKKHSAEKCGAA